jgi:hypothetical protein
VTQQPPPNQQGGYYHSQYSQQPSYPEQPAYPPPQQPTYPQQPAYPQQPPQYGQQYPQQGAPPEPQAPYSPQPYGSQPYSPQPYSPQPQPGYGGGQPPYGEQPGYFPGAGTPSPPPQKSSKKLWGILGGVGGTVLLIGGFAVVRGLLGAAGDEIELNFQVPDVGECITQDSLFGTETNVVDCGSAEAAWEVIGNDGTWTENDFDATPAEEICTGFEGTEQMLWIGEITSDGTGGGDVVCLVSVVAE